MKLYPGDIVEAGIVNAGKNGRDSYPMVVDRIDADGRAVGIAALSTGSLLRGIVIYPSLGDRLVACGAHEDCQRSIDLAMACASERTSHPISVAQEPK